MGMASFRDVTPTLITNGHQTTCLLLNLVININPSTLLPLCTSTSGIGAFLRDFTKAFIFYTSAMSSSGSGAYLRVFTNALFLTSPF